MTFATSGMKDDSQPGSVHSLNGGVVRTHVVWLRLGSAKQGGP